MMSSTENIFWIYQRLHITNKENHVYLILNLEGNTKTLQKHNYYRA